MTDVLLATCASLPDGEPGGHALVDALAARGLAASWERWDDPEVDWSSARVVAVRSTWDYEDRLPKFLAWAEHVERWATLLHGSATFRWNLDKRYLLELADTGVPIVPTFLLDDPEELAAVTASLPGRVVVKPRVAAGGRGLVVLDGAPALGVPLVLDGAGPWVVQPAVESVREEGETSVFVLGGVPVSQARKVPAAGELRVHEEYGGATVAVPLDDEAMLLAAETVAAAQQLLGSELVYAPVDMMRLDDGRLVVGELEVTEPGLYLGVLPANAEHFATAVAATAGETADREGT
jgi:glutathione synthase/RimK-type ligase-like ATP-grasp enzyme